MALENVIDRIVERLKNHYPNRDIHLSNQLRGKKIHIRKINKKIIKELCNSKKRVFFHGLEVPKKSWYKVSSFYKTSYNAAIIELCKYLPYFPKIDIKNSLLMSLGIKLGKDVTIAPRVQFDYFYPELISIGDNTLIGDGAKLWTHEYGIGYFAIGEINIGRNVYIGSESIIEDNSKIKACSIIVHEKNFK
jgi:acetyltransferase-like isoleucine patch superfamily enzyme